MNDMLYKRLLMRRHRLIPMLILLLSVVSCKKFLEIDPPVNELVSEVVFDNDATAVASVTGIYSEMMSSSISNQFSASGITLYTGMCADELDNNATIKKEFVNDSITEANHGFIGFNFWDRAYRFIYTANLCIDGLNKTGNVSPETKRMLIGESKFIRAFCFFQLVNLFGPVPLATSPDYRVSSILPRASDTAVYNQIITDLLDAQSALSDNYPTTGRVRPNKEAVNALLSRVYLYRQDWANAESVAGHIISLPEYALATDLSDVFLKDSPEAIWQLMPVAPSHNTWEGNLIIPGSGNPNFFLTTDLLNTFETGDQRKDRWIAEQNGFSYPYKYKIKTGTPVNEYYMVFRLAEQYLIRAEARAHQNKLTESLDDLNMIRRRAGLSDTTTDSQATLLSVIEHERRVELFAEWGHRWYDLKRTGRVHDVLFALKGNRWQDYAALWPIPVAQLKANPLLVQNAGY